MGEDFMKIKKYIFKTSIILIIIVILIFKFDTIHSIDDISRLNKVEIYDKNNKLIYEINNYHESSYVSLQDVSQEFIQCLLAVEDKNFYNHSGFDIYRMSQALFNDLFKGKSEGGSTITQQYIKNLYLTNDKKISRKINELYLAIRLENIYTKNEILEGYLNTIYFNHNIYGLNDASYFYFNKSPKELDYNEIAMLIAIIRSPAIYSPITNYEKAIQKKDEILSYLLDKKVISQRDYALNYHKDLIIYQKKPEIYSSSILYFKDYILKELEKLNIKNSFNETLQIYTDFNTEINLAIDQKIKHLNYNCDTACVIINKNGYYEAIIGGTNYQNSSFNIATNGDRDIGSTIKPLLYYEALRSGFNALTTFKSEPLNIKINGDHYHFENFGKAYEYNDITMGYALATSDNIYAIKTHLFLGMNRLVSSLKKFNVNAKKIPSLALGSVSMPLAKLTNIYHTFSNEGKNMSNKGIKSIKINNKTVYKSQIKTKQILEKNEVFILNNLMTFMFDTNLNHKISVTGSSITNQINYTVAGKSGLTDYDSYMVGFNPLYTIGIWSGHMDNQLLTNLSYKALPKQLFTTVFNLLMNDKEDIWYQCPNGIIAKFTDPTLFGTGYKKTLYFI